MNTLTVGNSAKLYCLNLIEKAVKERGTETSILDLGCGEALNFVRLLRTYPHVSYIGVEPYRDAFLKAKAHLAGLRATVINANAHDMVGQIDEEFDIVVSFSVLEHVCNRREYLLSAKRYLKERGLFLINYDAGHFLSHSLIDLVKGLARHGLTLLGNQRYYQSFVREKDFLDLAESVGFDILEEKFFNLYSVKAFYEFIAENDREGFMSRWLDFELQLNDLSVDYTDELAASLGTRNFVLRHKSGP